jgi:hypothetical protein
MEAYNKYKSKSISSLVEDKTQTLKQYHHLSKYSKENLFSDKKSQESSSSFDNQMFNQSGASSSSSTTNYYNNKEAFNKHNFSNKMYIETPILIANDPNEHDYSFDKGFESITGIHKQHETNGGKNSHLNGIMKDIQSLNGSNHSFNYNINDDLNHSFNTNNKNSSSSHIIGILTDVKDFEASRPYNSENYYSSSTQNYQSQSHTESGHYLTNIMKDAKLSDSSFKPLASNEFSSSFTTIQPQPIKENTDRHDSSSNTSSLVQIVKDIKDIESKSNKQNVNNYIRQSSTSSYKDFENYPTNIETVNKEIESYNSHLKDIMRDVRRFESHNKANTKDIDAFDDRLHLSGIIKDAHIADRDAADTHSTQNKLTNNELHNTIGNAHLFGIFREAKITESSSTNKTTYTYEASTNEHSNQSNTDKHLIGIAKEIRDIDGSHANHQSNEIHASSNPNLVQIVREIKEIQANPNYKRQMSSNNQLSKTDSNDSLDQHPHPHLYNIIAEAKGTDQHHAKQSSMSSASSHQHLNNILADVLKNNSETTTHTSTYHYQSEVMNKSSNTINTSNSSINNTDMVHDSSTNNKNVKPFSKPVEIKVNELTMPLGEDKGFGMIRLTVYYDNLRSRLSVTVHEARNLKNVDKKGASDPYAKIYLEPDGRPTLKRKTKIIKNNLNPTWQETFDYTMSLPEASTKQLTVTLKDEKGLFESKDSKFLGEVIFKEYFLLNNLPYLDLNALFLGCVSS